MTLREELVSKVVSIIDESLKYRIIRRPYDDDFAKAHGISCADIQNCVYVPCLYCGNDIVPRLMLEKRRGKVPVYCDKQCRDNHAKTRIAKIDESTDINEFVDSLIRGGYDILIGSTAHRPVGRSKASMTVLLTQTNRLLAAILEELRHDEARKA